MGRNSKDNSMMRYEELVRISVRYNDYIHHPRLKIGFSSTSHKPLLDAHKFIKGVKKTLSELDKEDKKLLLNEFFEKKDPFWWTKRYSKSTYYRRRYSAVKNFMEIYSR